VHALSLNQEKFKKKVQEKCILSFQDATFKVSQKLTIMEKKDRILEIKNRLLGINFFNQVLKHLKS